MDQVPASQARAILPELLDRVADGAEVTITRHGKPVAVLVRPDAMRSRRTTDVFKYAELVAQGMAEAGRQPLAPARSIPYLDEWIAELAAARQRRG